MYEQKPFSHIPAAIKYELAIMNDNISRILLDSQCKVWAAQLQHSLLFDQFDFRLP